METRPKDDTYTKNADGVPLATAPCSPVRRSRKKRPWIVRKWRELYWWGIAIIHARDNAWAAGSARYILEDLNHPEGVKALSEISGLPEGVIVEAMFNICCDDPEEND